MIYEIYPRSFQDSNGDGIGDLNGITSRLDYLQKLGVNAIWLTPIYPSPQVDFGYDISNYEAIDPQYGTMADFDRLVSEARKRDIRIIMDLVLNHTSDQDPWFKESASSRTNPKANWYVWRDPKMVNGHREPPNNWISLFGGSAWQWDPARQQYYYHRFYVQQPDLNWNNPQVRKAMYDVERFWIHRGVAGFRLDAITALFEDPQDRNEPYVLGPDGKPRIDAYGDKEVTSIYTDNLPEVHDVLRQLRQVADQAGGGNVVLIGETYLNSIADLRKMYGAGNDELQLPMDMQVGFINRFDVPLFRQRIDQAETQLNGDQPLFVFDNHDNARWDRYQLSAGGTPQFGYGPNHENIGRVIAAVLFASRDTALMYYGDEIGMVTTPPTRKQDVKDPIGIRGWPEEKGRDGERTPMQWSAGPDAGFSASGVKTWLPIPPSYTTHNVAVEESEQHSMLHWYRQLIALKQHDPALHEGAEIMLNTSDGHVLSWVRKASNGEAVVVTCNFTAQPQTVNLNLSAQGIHGDHVKTLLKTPGAPDPQSPGSILLGPYGVYIGEAQ
ncbi:MAG TPA: alpha-amylase family glycosyl hydrolase [Terracidiphilus sp.]|nr:alpha-amylase family glycosyl hydrolase [Terracidiphilus sp.]